MAIHQTAIIDSSSEISSSAEISANVYIGKGCKIGNNVTIGVGTYIDKFTEIGDETIVYPHSHLGGDPQDTLYKGEDTKLVIGKNCVIREYAPIHRGTIKGRGITEVKNNVFVMASTHIAHDCTVEDDVVIVTGVVIGGHSVIGKGAVLGGGSAYHQFSHIGEYAMIGGGSVYTLNVAPYCMASGGDLRYAGLNIVGLKRVGTKPEVRLELKRALKILMDMHLTKQDVLLELDKLEQYNEIKIFKEFIENSKRALLRR